MKSSRHWDHFSRLFPLMLLLPVIFSRRKHQNSRQYCRSPHLFATCVFKKTNCAFFDINNRKVSCPLMMMMISSQGRQVVVVLEVAEVTLGLKAMEEDLMDLAFLP